MKRDVKIAIALLIPTTIFVAWLIFQAFQPSPLFTNQATVNDTAKKLQKSHPNSTIEKLRNMRIVKTDGIIFTIAQRQLIIDAESKQLLVSAAYQAIDAAGLDPSLSRWIDQNAHRDTALHEFNGITVFLLDTSVVIR